MFLSFTWFNNNLKCQRNNTKYNTTVLYAGQLCISVVTL